MWNVKNINSFKKGSSVSRLEEDKVCPDTFGGSPHCVSTLTQCSVPKDRGGAEDHVSHMR